MAADACLLTARSCNKSSLGSYPGANLPAPEEPYGVALSPQVRVVLDLDTDGDVIRGSISIPDQASRAFLKVAEASQRA